MGLLRTLDAASPDSGDLRRAVGLDFIKDPAGDYAAAAAMRHVAARTSWPSAISGSNTQAGFRSWNYNYVPVTALRIWFFNGYVTGGVEAGGGGDAQFRVCVEYPRGVWSTLQTVVILSNTIGYVDCAVNIPAFARYRISGDIQMAGSGKVCFSGWSNTTDTGNGDEYALGAPAYGNAQSGTALAGTSIVINLLPVMVQAISILPVWAVIGDSIGAGVNDLIPDPAGGRGLFGRSLVQMGPHVNVSTPGDQAVQYISGSNALARQTVVNGSGATRGILQTGTNDIFSGGKTRAQLESYRGTIRQTTHPGVKFLDSTILPRTNSTDLFKTAANQVTASATPEGVRQDFNNRLRTGVALGSGSYGTIDTTYLFETVAGDEQGPVLGTNTTTLAGVFIPTMIGRGPTPDGTHPHSRGIEMVEPFITRAIRSMRL